MFHYCRRQSPPNPTTMTTTTRNCTVSLSLSLSLSVTHIHPYPCNRYRPFLLPTKPPRATLWSAAREIRTVTIWSTAGQDHRHYHDNCQKTALFTTYVKYFVWQVAMFCFVIFRSFRPLGFCLVRFPTDIQTQNCCICFIRCLSSCWSKFRWCLLITVVVVFFQLASVFAFSKCLWFCPLSLVLCLWHVSEMKQEYQI